MNHIKDLNYFEEIEYFPLAYSIAEDAHYGQFRDEGTPYIKHIDGVINILVNELQINSDMVLAVAALHDVLEDSKKYTYDLLKKGFGRYIADATLLLTHEKGQDVGLYLINIDQCEDMPWLMKVKLADRLHNLRSLHLIEDTDKIKKKCKETRDYYLNFAKKHSSYLYNEMLKNLESLESRV